MRKFLKKLIGKKEVETQPPTEKVEKEPTLLEKLCGEDTALYTDLAWAMYLDPRGKGTYAEVMKNAEALEREGKKSDAVVGYQNAGALALYEANVDGVKKAFGKSAELSERKYLRLGKVPEKAIEIVKKYYEKELKPIETEPE